MTNLRMTREQSREQTRHRLLDAAQILFIQKGYGACSVEHIALEAGYTRGAFYSNFDGKPAIFLELLKRDHVRIKGDLHAIFDNDPEGSNTEARLLHYYSHMYRNNQRYMLWLEARLQASRDTVFRTHLKALRQEIQNTTAEYILTVSAKTGIPLRLPATQLALGFIALCDGIGCFYLPQDDETSDDIAEAVLTEFMRIVGFGNQSMVNPVSPPVPEHR